MCDEYGLTSKALCAGVVMFFMFAGFTPAEESPAPAKQVKGDVKGVNTQVMIGGAVTGVETNPMAVEGNGKVVKHALVVTSAFTGIELAGIFAVEVVCGKAAVVELSVDENLQPLATTAVRDGILSVQFSKSVQTKQTPQLRITLPVLLSLRLSGNETVHVTDLKDGEFRLEQSGTGAVTLAGKVSSFVCTMSGVGEVDAGKLKCEAATIAISGVGNVVCRPEKKLKTSLSGIGGVRCLTRPATVESEKTGLGDVEYPAE